MGNQNTTNERNASPVIGMVSNVDTQKKNVTLEGQKQRLKIGATTEITKDGKPATLSDIQPGDKVKASFVNGLSGQPVKVEVTSPQAATQGAQSPDSGTQGP